MTRPGPGDPPVPGGLVAPGIDMKGGVSDTAVAGRGGSGRVSAVAGDSNIGDRGQCHKWT